MKGLHKSIILGISIATFAIFNTVNATSNTKTADESAKKQMWVCETNASSSSNDADTNADNTMKKNAKSAKEAFDFAYKHCRDCTKITCTQENK